MSTNSFPFWPYSEMVVYMTYGVFITLCMFVAELLRSRFEEQGLLQGDSRGFEPHLTIMKLSRTSKLRSQVCTGALTHTLSVDLGHERNVYRMWKCSPY